MIWIANLNRVGVEFLQRFLFRLWAHPIELFDPCAVRGFQISDEVLDLLFCLRRKIFCGVKLTDAETHRSECSETISNKKIAAADGSDRAFPTRLLFFLTGKCFGVQFEVSIGERLREIWRSVIRDVKCLP